MDGRGSNRPESRQVPHKQSLQAVAGAMMDKPGHLEVSDSQAGARQRTSGGASVYLPQLHPPSTPYPTKHPDWPADNHSSLDL